MNDGVITLKTGENPPGYMEGVQVCATCKLRYWQGRCKKFELEAPDEEWYPDPDDVCNYWRSK